MLRELPSSLVDHFSYVARNAGVRFVQLFRTLTGGYANNLIIDEISKKIHRICSHSTVDGILRTLQNAYISEWIDNACRDCNLLADDIPDNFIRDLDQIIDSIYSVLRDVEQQLKMIGFTQQCTMRADLISDMFDVVVRDVTGRHLETTRRWFPKASNILVLEAVRARIENAAFLPAYDVNRKLVCHLRLDPGTLGHVLDSFVTVYRQVFSIYKLEPERIVDYLIEKQRRNNNSHYNEKINEYAEANPIDGNPIPATYFAEFVDTYGPVREVFYTNELNELHAVMGQLCLQRSQPPATRYYFIIQT